MAPVSLMGKLGPQKDFLVGGGSWSYLAVTKKNTFPSSPPVVV